MQTACELRAKGMEAEELYNWLEANKLNLHHWFFTTDLTYFVRGGRVSKASGFIGGVLRGAHDTVDTSRLGTRNTPLP